MKTIQIILECELQETEEDYIIILPDLSNKELKLKFLEIRSD